MHRRAPGAAEDPYASRVGGSGYVVDRVDPVLHGDPEEPGECALSREELRFFEDNGYLKLDALMPDVVAPLLEETERLRRDLKGRSEVITEPDSEALRTVFSPHEYGTVAARVAADPRILDPVMQILGGKVYIHHSRTNIKPALDGRSFPWHSDFETWHVEDGLPRPRVLTAWVFLTENTHFNGPLFVIPGSHLHYYSSPGRTPENNHLKSLKHQEYGTPSVEVLRQMAHAGGMEALTGPAGTVVFHEGNILHSSPDNVSPWPRTNLFYVYNSVENKPVAPYGGTKPRPHFLRSTDFTPVRRSEPFGSGWNGDC